MAARLLHHVEIGVKNGLETVHKFINRYKFLPLACRENDLSKQWLLSAGSTRFVVTEAKKCWPSETSLYAGNAFYTPSCMLHNQKSDVTSDSYTKAVSQQDSKENSHDYICHWHAGQQQNTALNAKDKDDGCVAVGNHVIGTGTGLEFADSVFNVALEVNNVADCIKRVSDNGGKIIRLPRTVQDDDGHVTYATIKSCVGNVLHTLIDSSNYRGLFLPGFSSVNFDQDLLPLLNQADSCECDNKVTSPFQGIDHVAFALNRGYSGDVMKWYKEVFGMEKFKINRDEDEEEGFVLKGNNIGLRLRAMNYRSCHDEGDQSTGLKFVLAESLPHQGPNQVDTFLSEHGGPGVQHIGLYSNNIIDAVQSMAASGAAFMDTPPTYYSKVGKLEEIEASGEDLDVLQKFGILLDSEADGNAGNAEEEKYLMQVFTKPLFDHDTFFLEIIQRCGATGFGAGNISALWRSVEAFFQSKKKAKLQGDGSC